MPHSNSPSDADPLRDTQSLLADAGQQTQESEFFNPLPPGYKQGRHKFVIVLGTVMSGLGKGIFSSSLAKLLKDKGLSVVPVKMEGYLNLDSGTLNPYRHGEVFVLDDGMETDMDLGTYERMLDQDLTRSCYTTSGQIFKQVLDKERHGGYLGRDVQMIPHVTGEVKYMLRELAVKSNADVVFVEVGGTVGDQENAFYIESLRQLAFEEGEKAVCFVALTYVIEPPALGEQKSKAAQLGLKKLMEAGIQPHMVAIRAQHPAQQSVREKIAMFSNVPLRRIFSMHDRDSIYTIPDGIREAGLDREVLTMLQLHDRVDIIKEDRAREDWANYTRRLTAAKKHKIKVGITGKYAALRDAYASIDKALEHASTNLEVEIETQWIDTTKIDPRQMNATISNLDAVIVPGGFGVRGTESKIACVRSCRENKIPYLGICLGFQMAVIEYARNVVGLEHASSTEFDSDCEQAVIDILPEQKQIEGLGGNMRLGGKDVLVKGGTLAAYLFVDEAKKMQDDAMSDDSYIIRQRFRHRFEVDPSYIDRLTGAGLIFSGRHPEQPIMQILELSQSEHPYFVAGQFHPELLSRPLRPHPMFMGLIAAAIQHANPDLPTEEISTRWLRDSTDKKATA